MRLTLPKKLLRYVQPRDREHEIKLAILWSWYKQCARENDDGRPSDEIESYILGTAFGIPENDWHRFHFKGPDLRAQGIRALRWLAEEYKKHQHQQRKHQMAATQRKQKKPQEPKKPVVILRKHREQE